MALNINGTTGISGVDGSASAPALQGTDSNTGINFGTDTVNINTGGTTRATVNSSGNLGLGTTSPSQQLTLVSSGDSKINIKGHGSSTGYFIGMSSATDAQIYNAENGFIQFATNDLERARLDADGKMMINTTSNAFDSVTGNLNIANTNTNGHTVINCSRNTTSARSQIRFSNPNGNVGSIQTGGSGTSYNTSSDYRLKENEVAISDGISRLKQLKPYKFNFKTDSSTILDGFFAHEVSSIVPEAITGTKDAVVTQAMIDAGDFVEGTLNDPINQAIDHSKLVPLLTAALQEAVAKIETLETKVAALEAG
tara:strand:- start:6 stop:938 length:933 start_codon:yes stop_codon:yes gene_type:complete